MIKHQPSDDTAAVDDDDDGIQLVTNEEDGVGFETSMERTSGSTTAAAGDDLPIITRRCLDHPRIQELYQSTDWWSLWIGLLSFALGLAVVFGLAEYRPDDTIKYLIPQPEPWKSNPFEAWNAYNAVGVPILLSALAALYLCALYYMGKLVVVGVTKDNNNNNSTDIHPEAAVVRRRSCRVPVSTVARQYLGSFAFLSFLATIAIWLGSNEYASKHGLGYAVWAICLGMLVTNGILPCCVSSSDDTPPWWLMAAPDGEFFIKCSLVLLAVEMNVLIEVGGPGMIVAWIGSPLAIAAGFYWGMTLFHTDDSVAMLISVGAAWCGASAMSAVAPIVGASSADLSLAISVVAFFTMLFTFAQPYFALAVGMPDSVAGAWIGASVDQTGNVVVSAAILSEQATQVASIVKMVLNAGLGVMASVVSCYWHCSGRNDLDDEQSGGATSKQRFTPIMLWDKFPKFTLGFLITSAILTVLLQNLPEDSPEAEALPSAVSSLNRWWFAIAFCGIGLTTNVKTLWKKAWNSGMLQVYLLANTMDILLALGLAYLVYS